MDLEVLDRAIRNDVPNIIELRRYLHQYPELSHEEFQTTRFLATKLAEHGMDVRVRPEGTGFYADISSANFDPAKHKTVAIRCDLDGLAIEERSGAEYTSLSKGVMHACGHDAHMSVVASVGLSFAKVEVPGRIRLIFQHAEESTPGGSEQMIEFGAIEGVDYVLGLHVDPTYDVGTIGVKSGAFTAAFDVIEVTVVGKSGHGARPYLSVDPIFVLTQCANALYTAIGRNRDARDPMVISLGRISGGAANNVIPDTAFFGGSIRTLSQKNRDAIEPLVRRILDGVCGAHGATYELNLERGAPAIRNDPEVTNAIRETGRQLLGDEHVIEIPLPSMGSEDFANYVEKVPGAMFRLGVSGGEETSYGLHSAHFNIDERALEIGTRILARTAGKLLGA